jgi:putative DNA primase/helicase
VKIPFSPSDPHAWATYYASRGWAPIPVPYREKGPRERGWQNLRLRTPDEIDMYFSRLPQNVGVIVGAASGNLVDIDLDASEAVRLAPRFLPPTPCRFGRQSKPASHWVYRTPTEAGSEKFPDIPRTDERSRMLVELRSGGGAQTLFPGSTHPSGEEIRFIADDVGDPAEVAVDTLRQTVIHLAVAAILARHWPGEGTRQMTALAAAGLLLRAGVAAEVVERVLEGVEQIAGDPDDIPRRVGCVRDTADALGAGGAVTGGTRLAELLTGEGEKVVRQIRRWLGTADDGIWMLGPSANANAPAAQVEPDQAPLTLTDAGNARRFAREHGADVRYCATWKSWLVWDARRWKRDEVGRVMELAKVTARALYAEAAAEPDRRRRDALANWAQKTESEGRLRAMLALAQSDPGIACTPDLLDRDPHLLNTPAGTVDLRTGIAREPRREDYITKLTAASCTPDAQHPRWSRFLDEILPDPVAREYVQRWAGYSATGSADEEKFAMAYGPTAGGKTTLFGALRKVLGDYAAVADISTFVAARPQGGAPREDIARLQGRRLVVSSEVTDGMKLAEGLVKLLVGGETITARALYRGSSEFDMRAKITIAANYRPTVRDDDDAMWRRIVVLPFRVSIPEDKRDPEVKRVLHSAEAGPAILAWVVEGARLWYAQGLGRAPDIEAATREYRTIMNPIAGFVEDRCIFDPGTWVSSEDLWWAYTHWCRATGEVQVTPMADLPPIGRKAFGERVARLDGVEGKKSGGVRGFIGIGLKILPARAASSGRVDGSGRDFE